MSSIRLVMSIALLSFAFGCATEEQSTGADAMIIQLEDMEPANTIPDGETTDALVGDTGVAPADTGTDAGMPTDLGAADTSVMTADAMPDPDAMPMPDAMASLPFELRSTGFSEGDMIPYRFTCFGDDVQPKLTWTDPPAGTESFALVLIDESFDFVHYVAINIPAETRSLREGASDNNDLPMGTREIPAYGGGPFHGPCTPPPGPNTYAFRLYALDQTNIDFPFSGRMGNQELSLALDGHTLGIARLSGTCQPPD